VMAFNFDGGSASNVTIGAVGADRWHVEIFGRASHAGVAPERGISSTMILALALADVKAGGWFGKVAKGKRLGTSNVGPITGGEGRPAGDATNVQAKLLPAKPPRCSTGTWRHCQALSRSDAGRRCGRSPWRDSLEPIFRRLETGSFTTVPDESIAAGWTGVSPGRAFVPYASAGAPAVDDACTLRCLMATRTASVGGVGWHDAEVNREHQECE